MKKTLFALFVAVLACTRVAAQYDRTVVVEEGTGTWCPWCVRGIAALEYMNWRYPSTFIGIAVHAGDAMQTEGYAENLGLDGYPGCNVNRSLNNKSVGVEEVEGYYNQIRANQTWARATVNARIVNGAISVEVDVEKPQNRTLNIAYVLCEDGVTGYAQRNAYAGGSHGAMRGFENKPANIDNQVFNDVARSITPSYQGARLSGNRATTSLSIPAGVQNRARLSVVVLLLDANSGEIVNAAKSQVR